MIPQQKNKLSATKNSEITLEKKICAFYDPTNCYNSQMLKFSSRTIVFLSIIICISAFGVGVMLSGAMKLNKKDTVPSGILWPNPHKIENFDLTDQFNKPLTLDHLKGKWSIVFFGFINCPDICPTTLQTMARAHKELQKNSVYSRLGQIIFVSVDPERDTPDQLRKYASHFSPDLIAATTDIDSLKKITKTFKSLFMKNYDSDGSYSVDHSSGIFLISPEREMLSVLTYPHSYSAIIERFEKASEFYNEVSP
jgi:protein SCO1/2